jgi:hypothetical protein
MRKRRPNYRLVKIHRNYSVEEVARLFGTHKNTVRAWVKAGLPTCDGKRPLLILGPDLAAYLKARRTKNKRPCQPIFAATMVRTVGSAPSAPSAIRYC